MKEKHYFVTIKFDSGIDSGAICIVVTALSRKSAIEQVKELTNGQLKFDAIKIGLD